MLNNIKSGFILCAIILAPCGLLLAAENSAGQGTDNASIVKSQEVGNKICPVTGEKIEDNERVTYEYKGKIYNLCCSGCIEEFKKDPNKYIQKISEEMDSIQSSVEKK